MASPIKPALVSAYGKESFGFVLTVADPSAPKVSELTAASGLNITCMLLGEQEGVTANTEKVTLPRRLCETVQFQSNGPTTYEMPELTVTFDPQADDSDDGKKAWGTLVEGVTGYLWHRLGKDAMTDVEVGDYVNLIPVEFGPQTPTKTGNGADAVVVFKTSPAVTDTPHFNVKVVAGS